ncbi:hypothetical protein Vadar_024842 [Vaccinium darrowii]|uniref:Uncharacterized protein n=1 Tax=Vaccinium darrowii TaxID=229202 RepID=A0ACB7Z5V6_9ERIC|nr:hypothetical protein Vadar_024842 [Vaccinium darrowii]
MVHEIPQDLGTFDLGNEKYMITLEDVLNLTGLTIASDAIVWKEDKDTDELCEKYLGKVPKTEKAVGKVKLEWLRDNFQKLKKNASLKDIENSARAYLLHTIGAFIFADGSGALVSSIYLTFLDDFDKAKTFSWGSAMLTQLVTNLQKDPSKKGSVNLFGNAALLMLLEAWVDAESKLSKVTMQYAKQLEFLRDLEELYRRNRQADKAVQDMERKCDQKLAEHKEESHQYLMRLPEEHAALQARLYFSSSSGVPYEYGWNSSRPTSLER